MHNNYHGPFVDYNADREQKKRIAAELEFIAGVSAVMVMLMVFTIVIMLLLKNGG